MADIFSGYSSKRTFSEIRDSIILSLASGLKTINQISSDTRINWKTVQHHLVYLVGKGLAREVVSSAFVRIFELTEFGKDYVRSHSTKRMPIQDNKIIRIGEMP